jgi:hypothetical protein
MYNKIINYVSFFSHAVLANIIFASLSYGQLKKNLNLDLLKFSPILILIGGIQALIMMQTAIIGKKKLKLSIVTIQLVIIIIGYIMMLIINNLFLNHSILTRIDVIGLLLVLIGIFIGEKYTKCN